MEINLIVMLMQEICNWKFSGRNCYVWVCISYTKGKISTKKISTDENNL
jgi:hypothetical protein